MYTTKACTRVKSAGMKTNTRETLWAEELGDSLGAEEDKCNEQMM